MREGESARRAFKVEGKAVRVRDTLVLLDADGYEAAKIKERALRMRDTMGIERQGGTPPCTEALVGVRERFKIDVDGASDLSAHGDLTNHV